MNEPDIRGEILSELRNEKSFWDDLAALGTSEQMNVPLNDTWTFGSLAVHLLAWRMYGLERFEAAAEGRPDPPAPFPESITDVDEANAFFQQRDADVDVQRAVEQFSLSFDRILNIVDRLPESALSDPDAFPNLEGRSLYDWVSTGDYFEHVHGEHAGDIQAWRTLTGTLATE